MDKFEKLVNEIMKECADDGEPVTRAEAEEMAKMELGAKVNCKRYEQSTPTKKKAQKPREIKVSEEKKELFLSILHNLDQCKGLSLANVQVLKENKLISVQIGNKTFEINIVEKRPPKK